jgi:hypothetical protein
MALLGSRGFRSAEARTISAGVLFRGSILFFLWGHGSSPGRVYFAVYFGGSFILVRFGLLSWGLFWWVFFVFVFVAARRPAARPSNSL